MICIYVNTQKIIIATDPSVVQNKNTKKSISYHITDISEIKKITEAFLTGKTRTKNIILQGNTQDIYNQFIFLYPEITAAGGAVVNQHNQLLMIKRRGFWDLPKGKTEADETIEESALREVKEETGASGLKIIKKLPDSFHMYKISGQYVTKRTFWYQMSAPFQNLTPQTEEDIELTVWIDKKDVNDKKQQAYDSLKPIIESIEL